MSEVKVLIAAGGTGGHVYPAIAIADALRESYDDIDILFVGTKDHMEWKTVPKAGYDITSIWISGFHRRLTPKNLLFPFKLATSLVQSLGILGKFKPDVVISCGGYAAGPIGWVAAKKGVPLIVQEQNSYPGVTNRILGKSAEHIFTAFKDADHYFPIEKTEVAGNPTRKSLTDVDSRQAYKSFGFSEDKKTLLVLGGSGGAKSINEAMLQNIEKLHDNMELQIIWQCGKRYYDQLRRDIDPQTYEHLLLKDFIHDMPSAYEVADIVVSRAGALSCAELALTGNASILVPSPNVAGNHQTKNAQSMVEEGAAEMAADEELKETLPALVKKVISSDDKLEQMKRAAKELARPEAAKTIANKILALVKQKKSEI
ncbi:undecaprenyldiphospho-muramoylpentapeptide beta-N-acetylglucosaminyltransferase [Aliifodinibius halophilus]|uniref:UDP-N-acetylglucosamine--N-acetylmuramyl-(pentapeptide) pyrophosphoryl-undecaprenol N-acetylglucosamine transferase n=2 Tax=Fodinibius halophilus TaxID=1736908 RepID=A0A6M1TBR4_9BACT|nr:undecaprenyldiphospho-muramoylpentapeptide beta-N-acetylglucosaminyltransferase [Fodinibius halophilus]